MRPSAAVRTELAVLDWRAVWADAAVSDRFLHITARRRVAAHTHAITCIGYGETFGVVT